MRRHPAVTLIIVSLILSIACSDSDLRHTKPDRTRDADGIIKLYNNRRQGDWMLKGKVIQVEAAIVTEANRGSVVATGRESLTPIPMSLSFHPSERQAARLAPGDLITFKGICRGINGSIRFESCVILAIRRPIEQP